LPRAAWPPAHLKNLLDQQLRQLEKQFLEQGGFTEKLYRARQNARRRFWKSP
jgi:four helix bundle suffix protein